MPYRFKEEYRDAVISIPSLRMNITRFNINDEIAQKILRKYPQFAHNIELVDEKAEKAGKAVRVPEKKVVVMTPSQAASEVDVAGAENSAHGFTEGSEREEGRALDQVPQDKPKKVKKPKATGKLNKGKSQSKKH